MAVTKRAAKVGTSLEGALAGVACLRGLGRLPGGGGPVLEEGPLEEVTRGRSMSHLGLQKRHVAQLFREAWSVVDCGPDAKASGLDGILPCSHQLWLRSVPLTALGLGFLLGDRALRLDVRMR